MKFIKIKSFTGFVKVILDVLFIAGIGFLLASPVLANKSVDIFRSRATEYLVRNILIILVCSDIVILYVLYELRKIFKTIIGNTPFVETNVRSLFRMGLASFALAVFFVFKLFVLKSFLTYLVILVLIIAGCFSWTLSELFKEAMRVKDENDLTI